MTTVTAPPLPDGGSGGPRAHNPTDDNMVVGPDTYDNYKRQVNSYGETIVYLRDCGQLVPKPVAKTTTDWCDRSDDRSTKTKEEASHQQMVVDTVPPPHPTGGTHPHAAVPIVTATIVP